MACAISSWLLGGNRRTASSALSKSLVIANNMPFAGQNGRASKILLIRRIEPAAAPPHGNLNRTSSSVATSHHWGRYHFHAPGLPDQFRSCRRRPENFAGE